MLELWQVIAGGALMSGLAGVLVQVLVPKRRDRLDRADVLTNSAMRMVEQAVSDSKEARARLDRTEEKLDRLSTQVEQLKRENETLRTHLQAFIRAWKTRLPDVALPVNVETYFN